MPLSPHQLSPIIRMTIEWNRLLRSSADRGALDADHAERAGAWGRRYQDIHDALEGISHKVLTDTLRRRQSARPHQRISIRSDGHCKLYNSPISAIP